MLRTWYRARPSAAASGLDEGGGETDPRVHGARGGTLDAHVKHAVAEGACAKGTLRLDQRMSDIIQIIMLLLDVAIFFIFAHLS